MSTPIAHTTPQTLPSQPAGTPVGGNPPAAHTGAMGRILSHITDPELRAMLQTPRGGQLARAISSELDIIHATLANPVVTGNAGTLITDVEAGALQQWLHEHFQLTGSVEPNERLVTRLMLTLHGMAQQLQELQRTLAETPKDGKPVE